MTDRVRTTDPEVIRECTSRIIQSGVLGRGQILARLLEYLADRAVRGEVPKEFDISVDVLGKHEASADGSDAQTRVQVYKLRSRLDTYYAGPGSNDPFRLEIPKGAYHLAAVASEPREKVAAAVPKQRVASYAGWGLLLVSIALNVGLLITDRPTDQRDVFASSILSGFIEAERPVLVVLGDHFFFGEGGPGAIRIRDVAINSKEELLQSRHHESNPGLVFETLSYLPKSVAYSLQTILPIANSSSQKVSLKLVSELTSEDLRDYDVIYVGFVRAMGSILRDYYFARSNFESNPPLFMSLVDTSTGTTYLRSGPVPQHNKDYGLVARFTGPAGNEILVFAGIGDVGVLAAVHSFSTQRGAARIEEMLRSTEVEISNGFEVLLEADGHSRTDLDLRVVGVYPFGAESGECCPQTSTAASSVSTPHEP